MTSKTDTAPNRAAPVGAGPLPSSTRVPAAVVVGGVASVGCYAILGSSGITAAELPFVGVLGICAAGGILLWIVARLRSRVVVISAALFGTLFSLFQPAWGGEIARSLALTSVVLISLVVPGRPRSAATPLDDAIRTMAVGAGWLGAVSIAALVLGHHAWPSRITLLAGVCAAACVLVKDYHAWVWVNAVRAGRVPGWSTSTVEPKRADEDEESVAEPTLLLYDVSLLSFHLVRVSSTESAAQGHGPPVFVAPARGAAAGTAWLVGIIWGFVRGACGVGWAALLLLLVIVSIMRTDSTPRPETPSPSVGPADAGP